MIEQFYKKHEGDVCLLLCNGISLFDIPMDFINSHITFGCNTIHLAPPELELDYYCAVDERVRRAYGDAIMERFGDIPKFVISPNLDKWEGDNIYRIQRGKGELWSHAPTTQWEIGILKRKGINYVCGPHVMMQVAYYMGFKTILVIGMEHSYYKAHFWGVDHGTADIEQEEWWDRCDIGHRKLYEGFLSTGTTMLNLTPNTNAIGLPRADWRIYYGKKRS